MSGLHPVYTAHMDEVERLLIEIAGRTEKYRKSGETDSEDFRLMDRVQRKCAELVMKMLAEDDKIMLMSDSDFWWLQRIVKFVHKVLDN